LPRRLADSALSGEAIPLSLPNNPALERSMSDIKTTPATGASRRRILAGAAGIATVSALGTSSAAAAQKHADHTKGSPMSFVTTKDGTNIFYKDWGPRNAQPIVFINAGP